jgi:hypothetical protein
MTTADVLQADPSYRYWLLSRDLVSQPPRRSTFDDVVERPVEITHNSRSPRLMPHNKEN